MSQYLVKADGVSIFLNSHQLADVEAICDRVAIIDKGHILKVGPPQSLFHEPLTLDVHVNAITNELLHKMGSVALSVREDADTPCHLLVEVQNEEQAADVAAVVHICGLRLYALAPRHRSLEHLFLHTIGMSRYEG